MKRAILALMLVLPLPGLAAAAAEQEKKPDAPAATPPAVAAPVESSPAGLSQSKFLGLLYSEIAKRTPATNHSGRGSATASFHVDASGRVDKVTIAQSTSPTHAEIVRKILTGLQGPPPPGGSFDLSQKFNFH